MSPVVMVNALFTLMKFVVRICGDMTEELLIVKLLKMIGLVPPIVCCATPLKVTELLLVVKVPLSVKLPKIESVLAPLMVTVAPGLMIKSLQLEAAVICGIFATPVEIETSVVEMGTVLLHQLEAVFQLEVVPIHPPEEGTMVI